ncbi:hypothetical protein KR222_009068, partial [Zaprionus bogoriensis]
PTNGHGYIQFEIDAELPRETAKQEANSKKNTVDEVLTNLFPNGFSNIFRFSGNDENTAPTTDIFSNTSTSCKDIIVVEPSSNKVNSTAPLKDKASYSYKTTVSKEYRRELRPGHTQIVVEKNSTQQRDPFQNGSKLIFRNEMQRINRAAVTSPVLPSLFLRPNIGKEDNDTDIDDDNAPIVILGEQETDMEDIDGIEDNQIAESQHIGQQFYQSHLPPPSEPPTSSQSIEIYTNPIGNSKDKAFTLQLIHNDSQVKVHQVPNSQPYQNRNYYHVNKGQDFEQNPQINYAPSRQFLKNFRPMISSGGNGPISKGVFHYEANSLPQSQILKINNEVQNFKTLENTVAQNQEEKNHEQSQQKNVDMKLHTKAIESLPSNAASTPARIDYSHYVVPTSKSLIYVTVNSPSPPTSSPNSQQEKTHSLAQLPSPHNFVAEAAAESSQHHLRHAPAPSTNPNSHVKRTLEDLVSIKPNGYSFVEVQKSINIHNKLISEKDGHLVEMHETIYHPTPHRPFTSAYSPEAYVSADILEKKPVASTSALSYNSLAANPINVERVKYDTLSQDSTIPYRTDNMDSAPALINSVQGKIHSSPVSQVHVANIQKIIDQPPNQVVEKHIPIPYAVPQPIPIPVHVEHYVDRPYPVETFVEQPIPYKVETIVEKIIEKEVPVEVERIVEKPIEIEKIVEKYIDRPMAIPIHVPVAIHMPMPPNHPPATNFGPHSNSLFSWPHTSIANVPPKILQSYYTRMLKKILPLIAGPKKEVKNPAMASTNGAATAALVSPPVTPISGKSPKMASFSLPSMPFDLRPPPPPPPRGSQWLQGARYIYNTLPADLTIAGASAHSQMVKSYIGPVPKTSSSNEKNGSEFDEFQRWRIGHTLKRSPNSIRNLNMEYGFKPPLVPSIEIDDKGMPLYQKNAEKL